MRATVALLLLLWTALALASPGDPAYRAASSCTATQS
jgi:hypothetical protein